MKKLLLGAILALSACGYESVDNTAVGQVKKVVRATPLLCPQYYAVDVSLGVMRNGVGSMSTEDRWFYVPGAEQVTALKTAADSGQLVKLEYDVSRLVFCVDDHIVRSVEPLK